MKKFQVLLAIATFVVTLSPITHAATSAHVPMAQIPDAEQNSLVETAPGEIFNMAMVEQIPRFEGGEDELFKYLSENITYPEQARKNEISGKVIVSFVVETDGSITNVKIVRSKDPDLDAEVVRVIKSMPKWFPGKNKGNTVRVEYILPVSFCLEPSETTTPAEDTQH